VLRINPSLREYCLLTCPYSGPVLHESTAL
jgi:hypothetical protein